MESMVDVASNASERMNDITRREGIYLGTRQVPGQEYRLPSTSCTLDRLHGYKDMSCRNGYAQVVNDQPMLTFPQACTGAAQRWSSSI